MSEMNIVILSPDCNVAGLRTTALSLKRELGDVPYFTMVGENATEVNELKKYSKVYTAGKTITSLFDEGIAKSDSEWAFFIMAGGSMTKGIYRKYLYFRRDDKDILFPVVDRKIWFDEASINGIMVHRNAFADAGAINNDEPDLEKAKLIWASKAIGKGYRFKAIVGAKII